ncbi:MAG: hypothetical protein FWD78_11060 [Treponema sp.]|nr:hypothetical protein [Treponema sp.]
MGRIKSALEIALEKTESVKGDKTIASQFESKQKGKKIANGFLDDPKKSIEEEIKKCPREEKQSLKQGIYDVLYSQLILPDTEEILTRVETAVKGLQVIFGDSHFNQMAKQLSQVLHQYMEDAAQYEEAIKRQYAPKLKQKEEEIAKRLGKKVALDPFQDPEFITFYNQNMTALKENYQAAIDQVKEAAAELAEK